MIFGAGEIGYLVLDYLKQLNCSVSLFIDNNEKKQKKRYRSVKIVSPSEGVQKYPQDLFIIANLNPEHGNQMSIQLQKLGVEKDRIVICNSWMILKMKNCLSSRYVNEDKRFIYHYPKQKKRSY